MLISFRNPYNPLDKLSDKLDLSGELHPSVNMASHLLLFHTWHIGKDFLPLIRQIHVFPALT